MEKHDMKYLKILTLTGALALAATGSQGGEPGKPIKMATIAPGSSAYLTMTTFASLVNQNQKDYTISVDSTGAATKHAVELAKGKLDLAMSAPALYFFLKNQKAMYTKLNDAAELSKNINLVMWFPYGQYHMVVYDDSGIKTLADLKGKKVFLGPPGGGAWAASAGWLKSAAGLDVRAGDVENVKASWSSALQGFQDRQFDAYISGGIAPYPVIEQLSLTNKIRLIGLTKEQFEANGAAIAYLGSVPGREVGVIRQGTYGDNVAMDHDIYTNGGAVGITARADLSADLVYTITKTFWDNAEAMRATTPWMSSINLEYAVKEGGMQLHPGAQRYYQEIGLVIPEGSRAK